MSNSSGTTTVTWHVTIVDDNQVPAFFNTSYVITVPETMVLQRPVGQIRVVTHRSFADVTSDVIYLWDPDNVTEDFALSTVRVLSEFGISMACVWAHRGDI